MKHTYRIEPCSGIKLDVKQGQLLSIIDVDGGQVVDFFAQIQNDSQEYVSAGVTIDCNESLRLKVGDIIYSNKYQPMFRVISDDVQEHDLLHPCCRPEMYDFFYRNGQGHPNCLDNINQALGTNHTIIHPINLFMYTKINMDGSIEVKQPLSKAGDQITLEALVDVTLGIAACSVSESACNSGRCTSIELVID